MLSGIVGVAAVTAAGEVTLNYVAPEARFEEIGEGAPIALKKPGAVGLRNLHA